MDGNVDEEELGKSTQVAAGEVLDGETIEVDMVYKKGKGERERVVSEVRRW